MPLVKPVWQPRQIADLAYSVGWTDVNELLIAVAVAFAECDGFVNSYNDNLAADGKTISSRDVGIWEINIPASEIGTAKEKELYDPRTNARAAFLLWQARGWEPWASYNSGIYADDTYMSLALLGVLNFAANEAIILQSENPTRATHHSLKVPVISEKQYKQLYPKIIL